MELVPDDEKEPCDLSSEGTGMNDGVGWKIVMCPVHAAAPDLLEVCEAIAKLNEGQGRLNMCEIAGWARQAIAKALGQ